MSINWIHQKQKYKIVYANGTEETDHSLINIAKNAIIDLKTKYHTIERKIKHQAEGLDGYDVGKCSMTFSMTFLMTVQFIPKPQKSENKLKLRYMHISKLRPKNFLIMG